MAKRQSRQYLEEFQPPDKKLVSEADLLIKELTRKQRDTHTSLAEQLAQEKLFERSNEFLPIASYQSGQCSIDQIHEIIAHTSEIEEWKAAGLCDQDVILYQDYNAGELTKRHPNYENNLLMERIQSIEGIISGYKNDKKLQPINNISTPADVAIEKPESYESKLLKFARANKKQNEVLPHPMDSLKEIKSHLEAKLDVPDVTSATLNKVRRKARKLANRLCEKKCVETLSGDKCDDPLSNRLLVDGRKLENVEKKHGSKWDVKIADASEEKVAVYERKVYEAKQERFYTVHDGAIVSLDELNKLVCTGEKVSLDDIKAMPKFKDYARGVANNILYLKNLPNKISEANLKYLCGRHADVKGITSIKIMTGRMKGQAFVTFSDLSTATNAVDQLNGLVINGKPIVAQFGKAVIKEPDGTSL